VNTKKQCEANLTLARRAAARPPTVSEDACQIDGNKGLLPWQVAEKMLTEGISTKHSSTWSLHFADKEFTAGANIIKTMRRIPLKTSKGEEGIQTISNTAALSNLSNGIMRDSRVFRIDSNEFLTRVTDQVIFETNHWKGWPGTTGPEALQEKAMERLRKEGWDSVRPALATVYL